MPPRSLRSEQHRWQRGLARRFGAGCVTEWASFSRSIDRYAPRLDLAVGPFANETGERKVHEYQGLSTRHARFLEDLWNCHTDNECRLDAWSNQATPSLASALGGNENARCFLAVEIENAVTRKHLMGGIMNATALGHLGIMVGWTDDKVKAMFRARSYLYFLESVDKPTMSVRNLLILSRQQAEHAFTSGVTQPNER